MKEKHLYIFSPVRRILTAGSIVVITAALLIIQTDCIAGIKERPDLSGGVYFTTPIAGLSLTRNFTDYSSLQGVLGIQNFPSAALRSKVVFGSTDITDIYWYGMFGLKKDILWGGTGLGFEFEWNSLDRSLQPFWFTFELGYNYHYLTFGAGVHYPIVFNFKWDKQKDTALRYRQRMR